MVVRMLKTDVGKLRSVGEIKDGRNFKGGGLDPFQSFSLPNPHVPQDENSQKDQHFY